MKKSTLTLSMLLFLAVQTLFATKHTVITSGFTYSPATTTAFVGDTVTISASTTHPLKQVDLANWTAQTTNTLSTGWGTKTTTYSFTIPTGSGDIYFLCGNHGSSGMKGMISVASVGITTNSVNYNVNLFPNPVTNGEFTIKADGFAGANGKIVIYNTEGQIQETHSLTQVATPVKTKLPAGVYFYDVIINSKNVYRGKFLNTSGK